MTVPTKQLIIDNSLADTPLKHAADHMEKEKKSLLK